MSALDTAFALLVPVALPDFAPGTVWEGSGLMPLDEVPGASGRVTEASVAAATSEATLAAWRQLAAGEGAFAADRPSRWLSRASRPEPDPA